jgi:hypothetical protein
VGVESDGVTVGLCESCFRDRLEELAESDPPPELVEAIEGADDTIDLDSEGIDE